MTVAKPLATANSTTRGIHTAYIRKHMYGDAYGIVCLRLCLWHAYLRPHICLRLCRSTCLLLPLPLPLPLPLTRAPHSQIPLSGPAIAPTMERTPPPQTDSSLPPPIDAALVSSSPLAPTPAGVWRYSRRPSEYLQSPPFVSGVIERVDASMLTPSQFTDRWVRSDSIASVLTTPPMPHTDSSPRPRPEPKP